MAELQVKLATPRHVGDISEIVSVAFQGTQSEYTAVGQLGYSAYLEDLLSKNTFGPKFLVVGVINGQVAAYADFTLGSNAPNFLTRIAVKPSFRGRGIAQALLRKIDKSYSDTSTWELDVFHSNTAAKRMYESLGFDIVSTNRWLGRHISTISSLKTRRQAIAPAEDPYYLRYGFTSTTIDGRAISIAGSAVRLYDYDLFLDNHFLSEVQEAYPGTKRAFFIANVFEDLTPSNLHIFEIDRSYRMRGTFID